MYTADTSDWYDYLHMDQDKVVTEAVDQKVVINGQEYDANNASELIGLGSKTRELEKQYNTSFDKVWPEYGRSQQTLASTKKELDEARAQLAQFNAKQNAGTETGADVQKAKEALRQLGFVQSEDLDKSGYVKLSDLDKHLEKRESERDAIKTILNKADELEKSIDGTDGRPRFSKKVVLAYAQAYNISDLEKAYEDMHKEQLDVWKADQVSSKKQPALRTLSGGKKNPEPKSGPVTNDNFDERMREALGE